MNNYSKIALAAWNGRISPLFDVTRQVLMIDIKDGAIVSRREESLPGKELQTQAERLAELGPHVLICGAISQPMSVLLAARNIRIMPFTSGDLEQVISAWLFGTLSSSALRMPGCCRRRGRCKSRIDRWQKEKDTEQVVCRIKHPYHQKLKRKGLK